MTRLKKINIVVIAVSFIINTVFMILTLIGKYNSNILVCLSLYLILFIPNIINKLFKINISDSVQFVFLTFIFVAQLLGSIVQFYELIPWYDSFTHFISGVLSALFALKLLVLFDKYNPKSKVFNILFGVAFTLMVASFWEIFEFSADRIFGRDAQKVLETGVADTMKDIICALLGALLCLVWYLYDIISGKNKLRNFIYNIKK